MAKDLVLNQVIAIVQGKKTRAQKLVTGIHHGWSDSRINGITRTYQPIDDDGDTFPSESAPVQLRVMDSVAEACIELEDFFNVVATQEYGNTMATGDIIIDDEMILAGVPISALLFIEKQLVDLRSMVKQIPVLPTDKLWKEDSAKNCWVTDPEQTVKTKKMPKVITKYHATKEHPAQTELISVDERVGNWTTIHMSGAVPVRFRNMLLKRVESMQDAVKMAREQANGMVVEQQREFGAKILGYLFKV